MASKTTNAALNIASAGLVTDGEHRSVDSTFRLLPGNAAPTVGLIGYGESVALDDGKKFQKVVGRQLQQTITLTAQLPNTTTSGVTLTASSTDIAALQKGQTLLIEDEIVRVTTAGTSTTAGINRAFAGSTIDTHVTSTVARIMSPAYLDTDTFVQSAAIRGEFKDFYPTQIMYSYEVSAMRTGQRSYLTNGATEFAFDTQNHMQVALNQLEMSMWYAKAQAPASSAPGSFDGISRLISSNEVVASAVFTGKLLNDLAEEILAWDNTNTTLTVAGNRNMKRIWDAVLKAEFSRQGTPDYVGPVKVRVDRFETSLATFEYLTIPNLKDGELYIIDAADFKLQPVAVTDGFVVGWGEVNRDPAHTNALTRTKGYYWIGTLTVGDERRHGKMTSITTTPGSYSGYL
ncbi:MAG: hypothetical protein M5U09_12470 [Gammaproteobacteria bacterium]|nr:hypothetical protein [Gammaproteobacteria bacterium]